MPTSTVTMTSKTIGFAGGVDGVADTGPKWRITFLGNWAIGDTWTIEFVTTSGAFTLGVGQVSIPRNLTGIGVVKRRIFVANGKEFNFCPIDDPMLWDEQDIGAGVVPFNSQFGASDTVQAFSSYQGRLAVFGKQSIQIWALDADPDLFALLQTLSYVGSSSLEGVQALGDLDTFFLYSSGIRSMRVRDSSLNAYTSDLGSPINSLVRELLVTCSDVEKASSCGIVDPLSNRYWLFLKNIIWVFSYFPTLKILAWSQYEANYYDGANVQTFVPGKFVISGERIYVRGADDAIYLYGGDSGSLVDQSTQLSLETPWLDNREANVFKQHLSVDMVVAGRWTVSCGSEPGAGVEAVATLGDPNNPDVEKDSSCGVTHLPYISRGNFFKLKAVSDVANTDVVRFMAAFARTYAQY